jgi:uncharacterized SAM-binding protein YcdF (DUF218 family)
LIEFRQHPTYAILPTGGWGPHFNATDKPHGHYIRRELRACGVPDSAFLPCAESSNTIEDAALAHMALGEYPEAKLIVVTSDFHEARASFLFKREFPDREITFSSCATDLPEETMARLVDHEKRSLRKLKDPGAAST